MRDHYLNDVKVSLLVGLALLNDWVNRFLMIPGPSSPYLRWFRCCFTGDSISLPVTPEIRT